MMAISKKILAHEPSEMEMLLPWYATGALDARQTRRIEKALAGDAGLARQYAVIQQERAGIMALNENLGAPSVRAMHRLFAAIDAEPAGRSPEPSLFARFAGFMASLSPRTLASLASLGAMLVLIQAGVIAALLVK